MMPRTRLHSSTRNPYPSHWQRCNEVDDLHRLDSPRCFDLCATCLSINFFLLLRIHFLCLYIDASLPSDFPNSFWFSRWMEKVESVSAILPDWVRHVDGVWVGPMTPTAHFTPADLKPLLSSRACHLLRTLHCIPTQSSGPHSFEPIFSSSSADDLASVRNLILEGRPPASVLHLFFANPPHIQPAGLPPPCNSIRHLTLAHAWISIINVIARVIPGQQQDNAAAILRRLFTMTPNLESVTFVQPKGNYFQSALLEMCRVRFFSSPSNNFRVAASLVPPPCSISSRLPTKSLYSTVHYCLNE